MASATVTKLPRRLQKLANDETTSPAHTTVRTFTKWTPAKVRAAEQRADSGNLYDAATLCEWLLGDEAVASGLEARSQALLGLEPSFEPTGDKRRAGVAVKALEVGQDYFRSYPESELEQLVVWRLLLGVAPGRHNWTEPQATHDGRILPNLEFWHPQQLRYDFTKAGWFGRNTNGSEFPIEPGNGVWVLHALTKHRPWSRGLWRSLARWVIFKWLAAQDYARHSEQGAVLVASNQTENPQGDLAEQRKQLAEDLKNSGADARIVLQAGWKLDLLEVSANTKQIYEAQIELANRAIAIRIRGGNLTTNVDKAGSKAATETQHKSNEEPKLKFDGESLSTTLHDQSLVWWAEFNFGSPLLAPYPKYPTEPEEDKKVKADTADKAGDVAKKFEDLGFEIDEKEFIEDFGLNWIKGRKSPEQRAKEKAEREKNAPPAPGEESDEEEGDAPQARKSWKPSGPFARAVALASGASAESNQGFIEGQLYADALTENAAKSALKALQDVRSAIQEELDQATGFQDLKDRLAARFEGIDAEGIATLTQQAMVMAHMAGHRAVIQDS